MRFGGSPGARIGAGVGLAFLIVATGSVAGAHEVAASGEAGAARPLIVATKVAPPFVVKDADGRYTGLVIELWERIADELDLAYEFRELSISETMEALAQGDVDVAVAALTVTSERETIVDFTHPFLQSGLAIAAGPQDSRSFAALLAAVTSAAFLRSLGALVLVLLLAGAAVWAFERRKNPGHFGGSPGRGLGAGFWWSAVTMTTVGYGDKAPVTLGGRAVALVWMFVSVVTISGFTATIASTLTVGGLSAVIQGPDDLKRFVVASVPGTAADSWMKHQGIAVHGFDTIGDALGAVADGRAPVAVYDAPILQYLALTEFAGKVEMLPYVFDRQYYGFGLPNKSPLRKRLNQALLQELESARWAQALRMYLGEDY